MKGDKDFRLKDMEFYNACCVILYNVAADRAKQIKTKATVNESPTDKLIRELKEENEKLKKMMEGLNMIMFEY